MKKITLESGQVLEISEESYAELAKAVQNPKRWRADSGEDYWFVHIVDSVHSNTEFNDHIDQFLFSQRNYFQTKKEAEKH